MTDEIINGILVYGGLAIITAVCADLSVRKSTKALNYFFAFLTILIPSSFAGLRYGIGTDYFSYQNAFYKIKSNLYVESEFLYLFINKFIAYIGLEFQLVLFITSFITTLFIYLALRNFKAYIYISIGMFVYMLLYYQISFNAIRQIAAMAILLYSVKFIINRNFIKFTIFVIIAMGFHKTAVLFFPLYILYYIYSSHKYRIIKIASFTLLIILMINFSNILYPFFSNIEALSYYAESYLKSERGFQLGLGIFVRTLPFIFAGYLFRKEILKKKEITFVFNVVIIGSITLLSAYSSVNFTERISYYFYSFLIIFIPYILKLSFTNKRFYIGLMVLITVILIWYLDFIYLGRNETIPYQWIINK